MKRILLIGGPGSGKSTLARRMGDVLNIPVVHLDMLRWNGDGTMVDDSVMRDRMMDAMSGDSWIVDGNYTSTLEMRIEACDTVIFLDVPAEVRILGLEERRGKPRPDLPWEETEGDGYGEFLEYARNFDETKRPVFMRILGSVTDRDVIVLKSRDEMDSFLKGLGGD